MKIASACLFIATVPAALFAQGTVSLPGVTVYSPRVANQVPAGTFATPASALRYEPQVDLQARNLVEGQADVTMRGGIFENTGFQLGALTLIDPQTGHYFAEIPVAPALLLAPALQHGSELALGASNATVGAITYGWRPIRTAGAAAVALGEFGLKRAELYQGFAAKVGAGGSAHIGADVAIAHSESDGAIPFAEHEFDRVNVRLQRADATSQTDLFAGYQAKFFGLPNLYTPFNSNETENLQTVLLAANHRATFGRGEFLEAGVFHRRNKDDYAFNRFAPVGAVHPFQHTTRVTGAAASGRRDFGELAVGVRAEVLRDELHSTSLTFGRYRERTLTKFAFVPEKTWRESGGPATTLKAGVSHDDTNRDGGSFSPVVELARDFPVGEVRRIFFNYAKTSQVPTYTALNSNPAAGLFRGNPNLGRSKSHNIELGVSGAVAGWSFDSAVFWRRDESLVDWTFRRGVTARTANAVDLDVGGFEAVVRRSTKDFDLVIGYTTLTKDADYRGAVVDASFYALNYARHRLTGAITARLGQGFEVRMDNAARIQADNLLRVIGGRRAVTSALSLRYRPLSWRGAEIAVQADNLWNDDFQEIPAVPAMRRQFSASLGYNW